MLERLILLILSLSKDEAAIFGLPLAAARGVNPFSQVPRTCSRASRAMGSRGDSDYEFSVDVPAGALAKLVFALLKEKYSGRAGAVDEFQLFCKNAGVEHQWNSYA